MPKIKWDSSFKRQSFFDYPKLKLEKNEKARVRIVDEPVAEFVHNLRKIVIRNGQVVMTTEQGRNEGETREVPAQDFIGKFVCVGDEDTLDTKGSDPDNCPACAAAVTEPGAMKPPQRRIVCHVLKYATKKGTFTAAEPFQAQVLAWEMPDSRFTALLEIAEEHGDLRQLDLNLGPCDRPQWQSYDIQVGNGSVLSQADNLEKAKAILQSNMSPDLTPLLGRKVTKEELQAQTNEVLRMWSLGFGGGAVNGGGQQQAAANAQLDFSSLIGGNGQQAAEAPSESQEEVPATEVPGQAPDLASLAQSPAPEEQPKNVSKTDEIPDLNTLLSGLA